MITLMQHLVDELVHENDSMDASIKGWRTCALAFLTPRRSLQNGLRIFAALETSAAHHFRVKQTLMFQELFEKPSRGRPQCIMDLWRRRVWRQHDGRYAQPWRIEECRKIQSLWPCSGLDLFIVINGPGASLKLPLPSTCKPLFDRHRSRPHRDIRRCHPATQTEMNSFARLVVTTFFSYEGRPPKCHNGSEVGANRSSR